MTEFPTHTHTHTCAKHGPFNGSLRKNSAGLPSMMAVTGFLKRCLAGLIPQKELRPAAATVCESLFLMAPRKMWVMQKVRTASRWRFLNLF